MKHVKVSTIAPPADPCSVLTAERLYSVTLGNHVVVRFASERHALAFQADASRFLSAMLQEANLLLIDAYTAYRLAWPYLTAKHANVGTELRTAEHQLDRAAKGSTGPNAVFFAWKALGDALSGMRSMALALELVYRDKTIAVQRLQMQLLVKRVNAMHDRLKFFGTDVDTSKGYRPNPYL